MRKRKGLPVRPVLLLTLAGILLLLSTVGSTRAALTYYSENYEVKINVPSIGVSLLENGNVVSYRNYAENDWNEETGELLTKMLEEKETLMPGKTYSEELSVENSGTIDSYVRVILYKNWTKDGKTVDTELSPDLIGLNLLTGGDWIEDLQASTEERTVLYYTKVLPQGQETPVFCNGLRIDPSIGTKMSETRTPVMENGKKIGTRITTAFAYDGYRFNVKAEVDAVQTHNAVGAIKSAWGIDVEIAEDGSLSLSKESRIPAVSEESDRDGQP